MRGRPVNMRTGGGGGVGGGGRPARMRLNQELHKTAPARPLGLLGGEAPVAL